jgi:hypothetical protein
LREDEILMYRDTIYVPNIQEIEILVLREFHNVLYVGHLGYQKTIVVVKNQYYWLGMKKVVVDYIARCLEFLKIKVENRHKPSFLQPFPILEWKWEIVTMYFITKLPKKTKKHDSIMVAMDKRTKSTHFIPMRLTHKEANIVDISVREIARIHGIPKKIVSDRDPKFTSNFSKGLFQGFWDKSEF